MATPAIVNPDALDHLEEWATQWHKHFLPAIEDDNNYYRGECNIDGKDAADIGEFAERVVQLVRTLRERLAGVAVTPELPEGWELRQIQPDVRVGFATYLRRWRPDACKLESATGTGKTWQESYTAAIANALEDHPPTPPRDPALGERFRQRRERARLSLRRVADHLHLTEAQVSSMEAGTLPMPEPAVRRQWWAFIDPATEDMSDD